MKSAAIEKKSVEKKSVENVRKSLDKEAARKERRKEGLHPVQQERLGTTKIM